MLSRRLIVACGCVLAAALAGCGSSKTSSSSSASAKTTTTRTTTTSSTSSIHTFNQPEGTLEPATSQTNVTITSSGLLPTFFSPTSPWNTRIDQAPVDPNSARMMSLARHRVGVVETAHGVATQRRTVFSGLFINTTAWTTPIVTGGVTTHVWCRQLDCGPDDNNLDLLTIPSNTDPDPRYDGWFSVISPNSDSAYDLWRARRQADGWISYQYLKHWRLDGPGFQPPNNVSARGSGLPLFAGVITLQDLRSHSINHALAISVPGPAQRFYVQPASSTDGNGELDSLPEGARIRLRPGVSLGRLPGGDNRGLAQLIQRALQIYGAIVVDRSAVPTLYAQKDVTARLLHGNELQNIHLTDFDALQIGTKYQYPRAGTAPAGPATTTAETTTSTSTPGTAGQATTR